MGRASIFAALITALWAQPAPPTLLRQLLDSASLTDLRWPGFSAVQPETAKFYASRDNNLAWSRNGTPTPQAVASIRALVNAGANGLDPEDYDGSRWAARLMRLGPVSAHPSDTDLVRFDLALTVSMLRYASDLHGGRVNPRIFCFGWDTGQKHCDLVQFLRQVTGNNQDISTLLERLEPPFPAYRRAKKALEMYMRLSAEDDREVLPETTKPVAPGDSYPGLTRLESLLRRVGDLPPDARVPSGSQIYQEPLVTALKRFQERHGLDPDGRVGQSTLKQLNTPLSYRVRQLQLVLERWRWVPDQFARPPIVVNIPEFRLYAFNSEFEPELEMKVVVGSAYRRQTPVFSNHMTHVIFRPYWNVPLSIQRNELAPKIKKDPAYLADNDYEIVDQHGQVVANASADSDLIAELRSGQLAIRQIPGRKNALGYIKFMFPNEYNVYLHGTPAQALFTKTRRDFSHGCIRVEKPEELALWVLRSNPGWDWDRIREAENGAKPLLVNLPQPIPVLIVYGTAIARATGEVDFYADIYGHDAALDELLRKGYPCSDWKPTSVVCDRHPRE